MCRWCLLSDYEQDPLGVREAQEAVLRQNPSDKRPVGERWWFFFLLTGVAWSNIVVLCLQVAEGVPVDRFRFAAVAIVVLGVPAFAWSRRRSQRQRIEASARRQP